MSSAAGRDRHFLSVASLELAESFLPGNKGLNLSESANYLWTTIVTSFRLQARQGTWLRRRPLSGLN
jgi:hypothetical protein